MFEGLDLTKLYDTEDESSKGYIFGELTDELISRAEANIGYKLPKSYIELLRFQNGGYISDDIDSWLTAIYGIGPEADTTN
ncbi:MAG: SMI1/KNR4 family protein, partial [Clostridiales bacterium]|nr:SMI1/KNR4 family protein [Clostridiales bacterium]